MFMSPARPAKVAATVQETLEVTFKGKSIADVLDMTVSEAAPLLRGNDRHIAPKLATLEDMRPRLHQTRPKRCRALRRRGAAQSNSAPNSPNAATGRTLYLLDEPTTGLHSADIQTLLGVSCACATPGNTLIVIEHHLDVIRNADHIIDLGPTGGPKAATSSPPARRRRLPKMKKASPEGF
jgi:excinuclease ABC subunit A